MGLGARHASRYSPVELLEGDPHLIARIKDLIADLTSDHADLLVAFHRVQAEMGYVPREAVPFLAARFKTTPAMIFGAISFYSEVHTEPPPGTVVEWCSGPACLLKGSMNIRRAIEAVIGCGMNESTPDNAVGLRLVQCDGTCHLAPLVRVEHRYVGPLTVSDAIKLARDLKEGKKA
ncbi:MAG: NAD(P)H-dependent oxidoreductase subunit E [Chloroflexi bacterium]|nr:NAD(P)H-dependent oxidoreductase subunit E [Chloroflexota bacterium]